MADTSFSGGIAERYATAVFEIMRDGDDLGQLENDLNALEGAVSESDDLRALLNSPVYPRDEQEAAIGEVASRMGLSGTMTNTLRIMAQNRRLFVVPTMISQLRAMLAEHRGEVTAHVTTAQPLSDDQRGRLADTLRSNVGKDIRLEERVDESLLGGMVVRVGSKMIDTSIRSRLDALKSSMKEAR